MAATIACTLLLVKRVRFGVTLLVQLLTTESATLDSKTTPLTKVLHHKLGGYDNPSYHLTSWLKIKGN